MCFSPEIMGIVPFLSFMVQRRQAGLRAHGPTLNTCCVHGKNLFNSDDSNKNNVFALKKAAYFAQIEQ